MAAATDDLSRTEYPALLDYLVPGQALSALQDRIRRITKTNQDIADWIQERRKIEDQYVAGLKKLTTFKGPAHSTDLGVFQPVWDSIIRSVDTAAVTHHIYSDGLLRDVETPLRTFQQNKEFVSMTTISSNLQSVVKELEDSQEKAEKLARKGGKNNAQKLSAAKERLEAATQQWDSQAPFIFETLQALDEQRTNHLRDVLTQYETFEVDQTSQLQATAEALLNQILEVQTADEIQTYVQSITQSRPRLERRANARQPSIAGSFIGRVTSHPSNANAGAGSFSEQAPPRPATAVDRSAAAEQVQAPTPVPSAAPAFVPSSPSGPTSSFFQAPPAPPSREGTNLSEHSMSRQDASAAPQAHHESKLRSRIGTVFGRRRQSIGFGQLTPSKGSSGPFGLLGTSSSHGRTLSPRSSSNNLAEANNRLSSLAETPDSPTNTRTHANGSASLQSSSSRPGSSIAQGADTAGPTYGAHGGAADRMTVDDVFGVGPPPGPPPARQQSAAGESSRDAEGFSVRPAANDPISLAQREAAAAGGESLGEDSEGAFKVSIQEEPVADEDPHAKQAALHSVVNTLSLGMPTRKTGTVRGRRDVRNTIYVPASTSVAEVPSPASPPVASASSSNVSRSSPFASASSPTPSRPTASFPTAPESSFAGSDTRSIRSTTSLGGILNVKHHESFDPGLHASVIESVSATFEGGELKSVKIAGEAAFSYVGDDAPKTTTIKLNNFSLLEAIGPNPELLHATSSPSEFTLSSGDLHHKPAAAFTFRLHSENEESHKTHCLFQIRPDWKPMGDKLGLIIHVRLNPVALIKEPIVLRNAAFIAKYEGALASSVSAKPTCTHLKDKHLVFWRIPELTLTEEWQKIVIMRVIGDKGAEPKPGRVDTKWEYLVPAGAPMTTNGNDLTISQKTEAPEEEEEEEEEEDPFADTPTSPKPTNGSAESWVSVPTVWQIASGQYGAEK